MHYNFPLNLHKFNNNKLMLLHFSLNHNQLNNKKQLIISKNNRK